MLEQKYVFKVKVLYRPGTESTVKIDLDPGFQRLLFVGDSVGVSKSFRSGLPLMVQHFSRSL
jgi:hypothetical protein